MQADGLGLEQRCGSHRSCAPLVLAIDPCGTAWGLNGILHVPHGLSEGSGIGRHELALGRGVRLLGAVSMAVQRITLRLGGS